MTKRRALHGHAVETSVVSKHNQGEKEDGFKQTNIQSNYRDKIEDKRNITYTQSKQQTL